MLSQSCINPDHSDLDQICSGALQRRIHGGTFGKAAQIGVLAVDVGDGAHASEEGSDFLLAAGFFERFIDPRAHALVFFKVSVDELLGVAGFNSQIL